MLNYIKSELYRVMRMKGIYIFILCGIFFANFINLVIASGRKHWERYITTDFSFSLFTYGLYLVFIFTYVLSEMIFGKENKNDTLKNGFSFGLSHKKLFFGKILVTMIIGLVCLIILEGSYIGSAYLLLKNTGTNAVIELLKNTIICFPAFIAAIVSTMSILFLIDNETTASWIWLGIFYGCAQVMRMIESKFELIKRVNKWMLDSIFANFKLGEAGQLIATWTSKEASFRLVLAGILVSIIFVVITMVGIDKKRAV